MPLLSRHLDMNIRLFPALPSPRSWLRVEHCLWSQCAATIFITVEDETQPYGHQPCRNVYGHFPVSALPPPSVAGVFHAIGAGKPETVTEKQETEPLRYQQEAGQTQNQSYKRTRNKKGCGSSRQWRCAPHLAVGHTACCCHHPAHTRSLVCGINDPSPQRQLADPPLHM